MSHFRIHRKKVVTHAKKKSPNTKLAKLHTAEPIEKVGMSHFRIRKKDATNTKPKKTKTQPAKMTTAELLKAASNAARKEFVFSKEVDLCLD